MKHKGTPIVCQNCGYKPSAKFLGGIRWKLLALHYYKKHTKTNEQHTKQRRS